MGNVRASAMLKTLPNSCNASRFQEPANYEFSYEVQDPASGNDFGHRESRQGDEATGSYHVLLPDGRTQIVDYVANAEGYMPTIRYEGGDDASAQQNDGSYPAAGAPGGGKGEEGPY